LPRILIYCHGLAPRYISGVDLEALDALLQRYSAAESRIGANLHELDHHSTYQILRTGDLKGRTAAELGPALKKADGLWSDFGELQSILARARAVRSDGRMRAQDRRDLKHLLTGPSILTTTDMVPLSQRGLTQAAESEQRLTVEQLLSRMRLAYLPIRDGIASVEDRLRNILPRLSAAETTIREVKKQADILGVREPELSEAERQLTRLRDWAMDDPMAIPQNAGDELERHVRLAAGRVAQTKKGHDQLHGDLGAMAGLVAEVRTLRARAAAAREEALETITSPTGLVQVPPAAAIDGPKGLAEASASVVEDSNQPWQVQRQQVDAWLLRARRLRDQLRRAEAVNRTALNKRDELRGLLTAYRAKMAGVGRAEDLVLSEITDEAHDELFTTPTDLARAEKLIGEIANSLSGSA